MNSTTQVCAALLAVGLVAGCVEQDRTRPAPEIGISSPNGAALRCRLEADLDPASSADEAEKAFRACMVKQREASPASDCAPDRWLSFVLGLSESELQRALNIPGVRGSFQAARESDAEPQWLHGLDCIDGGRCWVVGWAGLVLSTDDGGAHWRSTSVGEDVNFMGLDFVDASNGWAVADAGLIFHTRDGGASWERQKVAGDARVLSVTCTDSGRCWAVGHFPGVLAKPSGSDAWRVQAVDNRLALRNVFFLDENRGWIVGAGGAVFETWSGGDHWQRVALPTGEDLWDVHFVSEKIGWVVGDDVILRTDDAGETWRDQRKSVRSRSGERADTDRVELRLRDVEFADATSGMAVGGNGGILVTENGGATWDLVVITDRAFFSLYRLARRGPRTAWAIGNNGRITRTDDGGRSWTPQHGRFREALMALQPHCERIRSELAATSPVRTAGDDSARCAAEAATARFEARARLGEISDECAGRIENAVRRRCTEGLSKEAMNRLYADVCS